MRKTAHTVVTLVFIIIATAALQGCAGLDQSIAAIESARDRAGAIRDETAAEIDELELMRESIPDNSARADTLDAALSRLRAKAATLDAAIEHARQTLESAKNPSDPLTLAADAIAPWVPAPIQAPLVLGAGLIATLLRSGALKRDANSIVESIEHAKRKNPEFRDALTKSADAIRSIQTRGARKLVQKAGA